MDCASAGHRGFTKSGTASALGLQPQTEDRAGGRVRVWDRGVHDRGPGPLVSCVRVTGGNKSVLQGYMMCLIIYVGGTFYVSSGQLPVRGFDGGVAVVAEDSRQHKLREVQVGIVWETKNLTPRPAFLSISVRWNFVPVTQRQRRKLQESREQAVWRKSSEPGLDAKERKLAVAGEGHGRYKLPATWRRRVAARQGIFTAVKRGRGGIRFLKDAPVGAEEAWEVLEEEEGERRWKRT